jgi:hypothetical protein
MNKARKLTSKQHKEDAAKEKKRLAQEARDAREAEKQLKEEKKQMQQRRKAKKVVFSIPEGPSIEAAREEEERIVKLSSGRLNRTRRPPRRLNNSIITIE